jgi:hypothetical protein
LHEILNSKKSLSSSLGVVERAFDHRLRARFAVALGSRSGEPA